MSARKTSRGADEEEEEAEDEDERAFVDGVEDGIGSRNSKGGLPQLLIVPFVTSLAFALIADIDSPRGGLIRVQPQNLISLAQSLRPA